MTSRRDQSVAVLLTVEAAAERLSTSPRFIRRLIAERRIEFVRVGRHVRISESALANFIDVGRVEPLTTTGASILSSTTRADGFVIVGDDSEGFAAGAEVQVWLYGA